MPARKKVPRSASELEQIPGVGPSIAADLHDIGITAVAELKDADPQALYESVCRQTGEKQDRCLLYVFRCAVYYASQVQHEPEKLKWWNWKDSESKGRR
jgi:DNA polymerase/3'-5' exonuclease PolX